MPWSGTGRAVTVLVCPLDGVNGADGGLGANAVWRALRRREGLRARIVPGSPTANLTRDGGLVALLARTQHVGRTWLTDSGADALIWGQRAGNMLRLSVISSDPRRAAEEPLGLHPWSTIQVPMPITETAAEILHAMVLIAVTPSRELASRTRRHRRRALRHAMARAETRMLGGRARSGVIVEGYRVALGLVQRAHGLLTRDPVRLARAVRLMETGLNGLTKSWPTDLLALARLDWADTVLALPDDPGADAGFAAALADARLDTVVAACRAGAARLSPIALPDAYAAAHVSLARALWRKAGRDGDADGFDAALSALTAAAWVWTRDGDPERRRILLTAMGAILRDRVIHASGGDASIRAVLEMIAPDEDIVLRAWAQAALGVTLIWSKTGAADPGADAMAALGEAVATFESLGMTDAAGLARTQMDGAADAWAHRVAAADSTGRIVAFQRRRA
ncbi:hypothetical protein [Rhodospira trueperi]|nr:hypothetical protein [Rhodospira trueperi]